MQEFLSLIGKGKCDVMNTMKGILVISPSELIFDQYVNLNKWDLSNKIWKNIDKNSNRNEWRKEEKKIKINEIKL